MPTWGPRSSDMEQPGHSDARWEERVESEARLAVGANRPRYSENRDRTSRAVSLPPSYSPPFPCKWVRDSFSEDRTLSPPSDQGQSWAKPTTTGKTTTTTMPVGMIRRNKKKRVRIKRVMRNRCTAVWLYDSGARDSQIAQILRIPVNVIRGWIRKYRLNGNKPVTGPIPMWNGPGNPSFAASSSSSPPPPPPSKWYPAVSTFWLPDPTRPQHPATSGGQSIYIAPLDLAFHHQLYHGQTVMFPGSSATMIDHLNLNCHHVDTGLRLAALYWPASAPFGSNHPLASNTHLPPAQTDLRYFNLQRSSISNSESSGEEYTDQEASPREKCKDLNDNVVFPEKQRQNTHANRVDNHASSTQPIPKRSRQLRQGDGSHLELSQALEKEQRFKERYPETTGRTGKWASYSKA